MEGIVKVKHMCVWFDEVNERIGGTVLELGTQCKREDGGHSIGVRHTM